MFFSFCKDTKKKITIFPIFFHIEERQAMNKSHCRAGYLRSFSISSGVFLPYFSHPGWEKYGRTEGEGAKEVQKKVRDGSEEYA